MLTDFQNFFHCQNQEKFCNKTITRYYRFHQTSSVSLHYLAKCQTTHSRWRHHWPTLIEPAMWPPNSPDLNLVNYTVWDVLQQKPIYFDDSRQSASWSKRSSLSGANCRSVWLIAPLVSGIAVLDASSSSKADTLNIWCKNCETWPFRQ